MGKKYNFRETASRRLLDRFSILPDEVAHHILSFVTFTDLTRVGAVSKTCRKFYLSIPTLDFDGIFKDFDRIFITPSGKKEADFLNSLDRYLFHRGHNRVQSFRLSWQWGGGLSDVDLQISAWIQNAVKCKVEVLDLDLIVKDTSLFVLPSCVFLSQSLRSLSVRLRKILQLPSSSFSSNLHFLKLDEVQIVDEWFFEWISNSCKCIKELQLIKVKGIQNITFESASLEKFKIWSNELCHLNISGKKLEDIHIVWKRVSSASSSKSLNIFAPNLKYFKWEGDLMKIQNLGRLMTLEKAEILMESELNDFDNALKAIRSIGKAKLVILNEWTTKALFREGSMLAPLDDICNLCLHLRSMRHVLVPAVVSLLGGMPNLNTLHIKCSFSSGLANSVCSGCDVGYWKMQSLAFIHRLKEATLELSNGDNGIEFARYILEHAPNLEKIVIFHLLKHSDVVRELKNEMTFKAAIVCQVRKAENRNRWSDFGRSPTTNDCWQ